MNRVSCSVQRAVPDTGAAAELCPAGAINRSGTSLHGSGTTPSSASAHSTSQDTQSRTRGRTFSVAQAESLLLSCIAGIRRLHAASLVFLPLAEMATDGNGRCGVAL